MMVVNQKYTSAALTRLNSQLPLKQRQQQLPAPLLNAHRFILHTLAELGRTPTKAELVAVLGEEKIKMGMQSLGSEDLVVLDTMGDMPVGAYPLTTEKTPHRIIINGHRLYAMCALDAVSVAPMFATDVSIESTCHVTKVPILIHMHDTEVLTVQPEQGVRVGIRWQIPSAVAAHSMCLQMVFLKDLQTAQAWQDGDAVNVSLFTLEEAVEFGKEFFLPLLA